MKIEDVEDSADIEHYINKKYGVAVYQLEYDPGGYLCFYAGGMDWFEVDEADAPLIEEWERLTGERLRRQPDEPESFDDALGSQCDAREREREAWKMK